MSTREFPTRDDGVATPALRNDANEPARPVADDRSVSLVAANVYALLVAIPLCLALAAPFVAVHGWGALASGLGWLFDDFVRAVVLLVVGIVTHEVLHAIVWKFAARMPWSTVRFGFDVGTLTPYAHCTEPMPARAYRLGAATPGVVLGVLPVLAAVTLGSPPLAAFGLLFAFAAGGDALVLLLLRDVDPTTLVGDHPTRAGALVFGEATFSAL